MPGDVLLAAVIGAQGLKGAVKVKLFTAGPEGLGAYGRLHDARGRSYEIADMRLLKKGEGTKPGEAVISLKGINTREAAEALKGAELFVARDALPATGTDEFYHADLIGLEAFDTQGRLMGRVAAIHNFGAGDIIAIRRGDGDDVLLAFTSETVPDVDPAGGRVTIAVPEDDEDTDHVE